MWIDGLLAWLHATAAFAFFAFLSVLLYIVRAPQGEARERDLARATTWYRGSVAAVAATGLLRVFAGAKDPSYYLVAWPLHAKVALFVAVAWVAARPTRGRLMAAIHLAVAIPLLAAMAARGLF